MLIMYSSFLSNNMELESMINGDGDVYQGNFLHSVKKDKEITNGLIEANMKVNEKEDLLMGAEK